MNNKYMLEAIKEANKAYEIGEVPIGAVIVKNGKIIGRGHNTKEKNMCAIHHAEISAIRNASNTVGNWRLDDCDIYVTLEPCPMCASAIKQARINRIFFGLRNSDLNNIKIVKKILLKDKNNNSVDIFGGYYNFIIQNIIESFFSNRRSIQG